MKATPEELLAFERGDHPMGRIVPRERWRTGVPRNGWYVITSAKLLAEGEGRESQHAGLTHNGRWELSVGLIDPEYRVYIPMDKQAQIFWLRECSPHEVKVVTGAMA